MLNQKDIELLLKVMTPIFMGYCVSANQGDYDALKQLYGQYSDFNPNDIEELTRKIQAMEL